MGRGGVRSWLVGGWRGASRSRTAATTLFRHGLHSGPSPNRRLMEKRVLLAVFLSFLVLFVYQSLIAPPTPVPEQQAVPAEATLTPPARRMEPTVERTPTAEPMRATDVSDGAEVIAVVADEVARDIVVETEQVIAVFSSRGGVLKSWRLQGYAEESGDPYELVPSLDTSGPLPFTLVADDEQLTAKLREALFRPSAASLQVGARPRSLIFEYEDSDGLQARKEYRFDPQNEPFVVRFSASVKTTAGSMNPIVRWGPGLGGSSTGGGFGFTYSQRPQAIFFRDEEVSRLDSSDIEETPTYEGSFQFVGVDDQYFLSAAIPDSIPLAVSYRPVPIGSGDDQVVLIDYELRFPEPPTDTRFYMGPKDFDILGSIDTELAQAVHFGFFSWLVVPLHRSLKWVYGYVGNYGWSIILLTIMINAAMFPLRHKSVVSMRKMQELQPEIKSIQGRYKGLKTTDPAKQKMNQEVMSLYRDRGVNPAGGCLPMLLTMPVLFAFYSLLSVTIEIRDAPFVLWIQDLSQPDPLYVTPILMGVTMVAQQRMTPSTVDATQQKVMMVMPVVFTFMFLGAPSGLVLYWFVSNLWGVGQQVVTNRIIGPPKVHTVRPPAERQMKKLKQKRKNGHRVRGGKR